MFREYCKLNSREATGISLKATGSGLIVHWLDCWRKQRDPFPFLYCHVYVYAYAYACVSSSFSCARGGGGDDDHYVWRSLIPY